MENQKVFLTEAAALKIDALIQEEGTMPLCLRVYIQGGGCSGFQYGFSFEEQSETDDVIIQKNVSGCVHTITLLIDPLSFQYLAGAEIDYQSDVSGEQFIIRNPNAKTTCGCGSSFSA